MNMKTGIENIAIAQGSGNPYADLGVPDADDMLVRAGLARDIAQIIKARRLTRQRAAELLGMTQPKLSGMLRGRFRGISQAKMIECPNRLGRDASIVVSKVTHRAAGHTQVVVA